jgi:transposase
LKWSRFAHVTLVPDEREKALSRPLLAAFEAFCGVPLVTVWDNPKTVVISRKGDLSVWNAIFDQVALDYRFAPSCAGRAPRPRPGGTDCFEVEGLLRHLGVVQTATSPWAWA